MSPGPEPLQTFLGNLLASVMELGHTQPLSQSLELLGFGEMEDCVHEDNPQQIKVRNRDRIKRLVPFGPGGRSAGALESPLKDLKSWEGWPGAEAGSRLKLCLGTCARFSSEETLWQCLVMFQGKQGTD